MTSARIRRLRGLAVAVLLLGVATSGLAQSDALTESRNNAIVRAIAKAGPAVVNISSIQKSSVPVVRFGGFFEPFRMEYEERRTYSLGSGVIFDAKQGYILTNEHVISEADEIIVRLQDGRQFNATVVGADRFADLAVLKIDGNDLPETSFGDSDDLRIGEWAIAIGNPFGQYVRDLKPSVTVGVISATHRVVRVGERTYAGLIQTDAAVNPGNSGGPLVNTAGQVIGINTFIFTESGGSHGVNFAIPMNTARKVIAHLIEHGKVVEPWLGFNYVELTPEKATKLKAPVHDGIVVTYVQPEGPADRAGLRPDDIITDINGEKVYSRYDARSIVRLIRSGERIVFAYVRKGKSLTATVIPQDMPDLYSFYGVYVRDARRTQGVVVEKIDRKSVFYRVLEKGDLIYAIANARVRNVADLRNIAEQVSPEKPLRLRFSRDGQQYYYDFSL